MIENNNPDINVDEIMAKIRAEIAGRNEEGLILSSSRQTGKLRPASSYDRHRLQSILKAAESNADIVAPDLPMLRYPKSVRWFAIKIGRIVLYLSRLSRYAKQISISWCCRY